MARSIKKQIAKDEYAKKVNPNPHKESYAQPPRPRSTSFKTGKDYNRQRSSARVDNLFQKKCWNISPHIIM